jgi:hypothetical protein
MGHDVQETCVYDLLLLLLAGGFLVYGRVGKPCPKRNYIAH